MRVALCWRQSVEHPIPPWSRSMSAHSTRPQHGHSQGDSCHQIKVLLERISDHLASSTWDTESIAKLLHECGQIMSEHGDALTSDLYVESIGRAPCLTAQWQKLKKDNITVREALMSLRIRLVEEADFEVSRKEWQIAFDEMASLAIEYNAAEAVLLREAFSAPGWADEP